MPSPHSETQLDPDDEVLQRILDAAHEQVMLVGVRRTTVTDIARRAGVSRMTLYTRFPDVTTVLSALMTRDFVSVIGEAVAGLEDAVHERDRIVRGVVLITDLLGTHPLFQRVLDVDPELLLPYLMVRRGGFQRAAMDVGVTRLKAGMAEGSVRLADPERLMGSIELAARGFALTARTMSVEQRHNALEDLARMVEGVLTP